MVSSVAPVCSAPFCVEADPRARKSARLSGKVLSVAFELSGAAEAGARQAATSKAEQIILESGRRTINLDENWTYCLEPDVL
jgi:hypothetical protein